LGDLDNTCPTVSVSGFPARGQQNYQLATTSNNLDSRTAGSSFSLLSIAFNLAQDVRIHLMQLNSTQG